MKRRSMRGRIVVPALDSLVGATLNPFPPVVLRDDRCPFCRAPGVSFALSAVRGGLNAAHRDWCPHPG